MIIELNLSFMPGDLLMMDNHRLLHGRTTYDAVKVIVFYKDVI